MMNVATQSFSKYLEMQRKFWRNFSSTQVGGISPIQRKPNLFDNNI